MGAIQVLLFLI